MTGFLLLFFISLFWPYIIPVTRGFLVTDGLVVAYLIYFLQRSALAGKVDFPSLGKLKSPILYFLLALLVSLFNAVYPLGGYINWAHHLFFFTFLFLLIGDLERTKLRRYLELYRLVAFVPSLYSIVLFISHHGQVRPLGITGFAMSELLLPALFFSIANIIFDRFSLKEAVFSSVFIYAMLATQTRGPLISAVLGVAVLFTIALFHFKKSSSPKVFFRFLGTVFFLVLLLFGFLVLLQGYSEGITGRVAEALRGEGSVRLRLLLWSLTVQLFFDHPLTGIGLAQFDRVLQVTPFLKDIPLFVLLSGLSTHNVFFSYLCETGILGTLGLFWFYSMVLAYAWRSYKEADSSQTLVLGSSIFAFLFVVVFSSLYQGWWLMGRTAYEFMFFLACAVVFARNKERNAVAVAGW